MYRGVSRQIKFLGVGIVNTLLDFAVYTFLALTIFPKQDDIWIVGVISGAIAMGLAYMTHQFITWKDHPASKTTILKFIIFTGLGLWLLRPLLLQCFVQFSLLYDFVYSIVGPIGLSYDFVVSTGAFGLMILIVMTYNFIVYDRFVFTQLHHTDRETD